MPQRDLGEGTVVLECALLCGKEVGNWLLEILSLEIE